VNGLIRLLRHLFGEDPPPRPSGHAPHPRHRARHRHHHEVDQEAGERRREVDEQVTDAADDGPAPTPHHGH
jgi:hypothetical protein